jgi:hypothetical protein
MKEMERVSDADARRVPMASSLSLLGLLKHCALWERRWFQIIVAGRIFPGEWPEVAGSGEQTDTDDFRVGERDTVEQWVPTSTSRRPSPARHHQRDHRRQPGHVMLRADP